MDLTTHIRTFTAAVRGGSFSEAARELGVVPSVVAKRIAQLEQEVQARLFERTTRKVALTVAGEKLYARVSTLVSELEEVLQTVRQNEGQPEGHLRVLAPTTMTMLQLAPVLCEFLRTHPGITLELVLGDRSVNPAEAGFDLAISGRSATYDGVVDVPLAPVRPLLCAAPGYLGAHSELSHPRELAELSCLVFSATGTTWSFESGRGVTSVDVRPRLLADDNLTLLRAATAGLGIALLPTYVARADIESGALLVVLPKYAPQENWFKAYVPRRKMAAAHVKALLAYLQERWAPTFPQGPVA